MAWVYVYYLICVARFQESLGHGWSARVKRSHFTYYTFSSFTTVFPFQPSHDTAMANLIAPPIHSAAGMPAFDFCNQAPMIPPATMRRTATTRLFRFTFLPMGAIIIGSENKSQYSDVNTFVGTSLNPNTRLVTIWPPNWNASSATGRRVMLSVS